ncbi:MAG: 3-phosphoshikimate 1-carboxyvinyltransferase [Lachnospiraceae bacterium]
MQTKEITAILNKNSVCITVTVPGSKSITNRALLLATLANGKSVLEGALFSADSRHFLQCVKDLSFVAEADEASAQMSVTGLGGEIPIKKASIYVGSAGTAARFLAGFLGCSEGEFFVDASEQMKKRPMGPLLDALEDVGATIMCTEEDRHFPMYITGNGIKTESITVDIDKSSQFLSALLISGCLAKKDLHIHIVGTHGMAYIDMTIQMMEQFGVKVDRISGTEFLIRAGQNYEAREYLVEPDASAACYFWAIAAVLGVSITVAHTHFDSLQGDVAFAKILADMGCEVKDTEDGIQVTGPENGILKAIKVDMHACSDQAITLAAIAPFADGVVEISGISHIRYQESNRLAAMVENLTAMGIEAIELEDGIRIQPGTPKATTVRTYDDHRLAMGFSVTGLRVPGMVIEDPMCCRKTFERYFDVLDELVELIGGRN